MLSNSSNAKSTSDTISFDGSTETVISGGTTTTTKYYSANSTRIAVRVGGSTLDYLVNDPLGSNSIALNDLGQVIALQHYSPYAHYAMDHLPREEEHAPEEDARGEDER